MPKKLKEAKEVNSVGMTQEAWGICAMKANELGLTRNDYIERCVRNPDNGIYNVLIERLKISLKQVRMRMIEVEKLKEGLEAEEKEILEQFKILRISPNDIP